LSMSVSVSIFIFTLFVDFAVLILAKFSFFLSNVV
jgi:hypothetical protein